MAERIKIVFMGTPVFAVASLDNLVKNNYEISAVVTSPDKPAGRGLALHESAVKKYACEHNILIFQPENLKDEDFIKNLHNIHADLFIVVAFRMLPEIVWRLPHLGTFNLHASLLPDYRGAAPINHAIINGEKETGVTTFFINNEIDKGNIILQEKIPVVDNETAGELHDKLMGKGADLVLKTVDVITKNNYKLIFQESLLNRSVKLHPASKIHKNDCRINWNIPAKNIFDFIRGLSPYPAAFTELVSPEKSIYHIKIFRASYKKSENNCLTPGDIFTDGKELIKISASDGYIMIEDLQLSGKKRMSSKSFLSGFDMDNLWKVL